MRYSEDYTKTYRGSPMRYSAACQPTWWFSDQYCIGPSHPVSWIQDSEKSWSLMFQDFLSDNKTILIPMQYNFSLKHKCFWNSWRCHLVGRRIGECLWRRPPPPPSLARWAEGSPSTFEKIFDRLEKEKTLATTSFFTCYLWENITQSFPVCKFRVEQELNFLMFLDFLSFFLPVKEPSDSS